MILKLQEQEGERKGRVKEEEEEYELKKVDDFENVGLGRRRKGRD